MYQEEYMLKAMDLAELARGKTSPNPLVGAVVVKNNQIVGVGWHRRWKTEHAEVLALNMAGDMAKDAELYVTLEPCCHYGQTPPCVEKIVKAGIRQVYVGICDPNPLVAGKGIKHLRKAGIQVSVGHCEDVLREQNRYFLHWMEHKLPYINLKFAMTLDGKIATYLGESKWITGEEARNFGQEMRAAVDGILVGINTVIADNPHLDCRLPEGKSPRPIILDSKLSIPSNSFLVEENPNGTIVVTVADEIIEQDTEEGIQVAKFSKEKTVKLDELKAQGVEVLICNKDKKGQIDLVDLCYKLAVKNITSLLVEGGGEIHGSFLQAGLFNRVYAFIAPKLLGGKAAKSPIGGVGIAHMADICTLEDVEITQLGEDILIRGDMPSVKYLQNKSR